MILQYTVDKTDFFKSSDFPVIYLVIFAITLVINYLKLVYY